MATYYFDSVDPRKIPISEYPTSPEGASKLKEKFRLERKKRKQEAKKHCWTRKHVINKVKGIR
jgi:hypothetical protein